MLSLTGFVEIKVDAKIEPVREDASGAARMSEALSSYLNVRRCRPLTETRWRKDEPAFKTEGKGRIEVKFEVEVRSQVILDQKHRVDHG